MKTLHSFSLRRFVLTALAFVCLPMFADTTSKTIDGINYLLDEAQKTATVACKEGGYAGEVSIPATVTADNISYDVTAIADTAFSGNTSLTAIHIPASIKKVGAKAFYNCKKLTGGVYITDLAAWCDIEFVNSVGNLFSGQYYANPLYYAKKLYLNDTKITELVIPEGVTRIGHCAFYNCTQFTSVSLPSTLDSIGHNAFKDCKKIKTVNVPDAKTWCEMFFASKSSSPLYKQTTTRTLYINNEKIGELVVPDGVTHIGQYAFCDYTALTKITIPASVTNIGKTAFEGCTGLSQGGVHITDLAAWCKLSFEVKYSNPLVLSSHLYLNGSELTELTIPDGITSIGQYAFYGASSITKLTIPSSVTSIGKEAFNGCSKIEGTYISDLAAWCSIDFGNMWSTGFMSNGNHSLYLNGQLITKMTIPEGVTAISDYAFCNCQTLQSVSFPSTLTSIGDEVFRGCTGLTTLTFLGTTPPTLGDDVFMGCQTITTVDVPAGSEEAYTTALSGNIGSSSPTIKTGIATVQTDFVQDDTVYDLQGQRVSTMHRGRIYIKGGKKILYR